MKNRKFADYVEINIEEVARNADMKKRRLDWLSKRRDHSGWRPKLVEKLESWQRADEPY